MTQSANSIFVAEGRFGNGVFAAHFIPRGHRILQFTGPLLNYSQVQAKGPLAGYPLQIDQDLYIDLVAPGCYVNHSCDPNAWVAHPDYTLVALRNILQDEEILYDYSTSMDDGWELDGCRCGANACRGVVRDFKYLPEMLRARYLRQGIVLPFLARRYLVRLGRDR